MGFKNSSKAYYSNENFKRLYWMTHKKQIKEILSRVNIKYLKGLKLRFTKSAEGANGTRLYCRYDGYEFQVSLKTINDELYRRYESNIS